MKKILFSLLVAPLLFSCAGDDSEKDTFQQRQVTSTELESGTATYKQTKGYKTYYLVFEKGILETWVDRDGKLTDSHRYDKYEIKGDSILLTKKPFMQGVLGGETEYYTLYINHVHWGYDKTPEVSVGGDQLLIKGDILPLDFATGYYDKSSMSLKN